MIKRMMIKEYMKEFDYITKDYVLNLHNIEHLKGDKWETESAKVTVKCLNSLRKEYESKLKETVEACAKIAEKYKFAGDDCCGQCPCCLAGADIAQQIRKEKKSNNTK